MLSAAVAALYLFWLRGDGSMRRTPLAVRAWSPLALPATGYSPVERLRRKTHAGHDRFTVESLEEAIAPRLEHLLAFFREPARREPLDAVLAAGFRATPLRARELLPLQRSPGLEAFRGAPAREALLDAAGFAAEAARLIEPLSTLERAELKVLHIDPGEGEAPEVAATVHYLLAGAEPSGARHQWNGEARLVWARRDWTLERWETLEWFHSRLAAAPFEEVTTRALAGAESYDALLAPSIDHFRGRIDAATGIDVYGHHGLAAGDADGDGIDDLYICMPPGLPNLLYRGRGDGSFEDVSRSSGADLLDGVSHALFLDLDGDGDQDLFLVTEGGIIVLANDGRGRFRERPSGLEAGDLGRSTPIAAAAADYDLDGDIDVYVCSYVFWRGAAGSAGSRLPLPYHEAQNGAPNFLLQNQGDGRFVDATAAARLDRGNDRFSFAASWGDYDGDGHPDLYVANDFGSNNLYRNQGGGTFEEVTAAAGVADTGAGMSVAWEDYDNDGRLDLYVGNMLSAAGRRVTGTSDYKSDAPELQGIYRRHARGNSLFWNRGDGGFDDRSLEGSAYFGRWAWASDFIDFNLDGIEDIAVQNGFITNPRAHDL
jgi:hypothetical protein